MRFMRKFKAQRGIAIKVLNRGSEPNGLPGFEESRSVGSKIVLDGAQPGGDCRNAERGIVEQLYRQHQVGSAVGAIRDETRMGPGEQFRKPIRRYRFLEAYVRFEVEPLDQPLRFFEVVAAANYDKPQAGNPMAGDGHGFDCEVEAQAMRDGAVADQIEAALGPGAEDC